MSLKSMLASSSGLARVLIRSCCHKQTARNVQQIHSLARNEGRDEGSARTIAASDPRKLSTGRILSVIDKHGFIKPEPATEPLHLGLVKVFLAVSLGLYLGAKLSMRMVAFLEEYNIFVPDEDDDDD
eukprot:TRINITY_DN17814_c0_g1_i1.p1 TRINITY_DN17814_c0_g1~~TRINITY_DN17814_c0_g1_i1.p1  ORF type:complete len:127 (-),score=41.38 TRINITY_DN17814_c0_g1_i1:39-419(-)